MSAEWQYTTGQQLLKQAFCQRVLLITNVEPIVKAILKRISRSQLRAEMADLSAMDPDHLADAILGGFKETLAAKRQLEEHRSHIYASTSPIVCAEGSTMGNAAAQAYLKWNEEELESQIDVIAALYDQSLERNLQHRVWASSE